MLQYKILLMFDHFGKCQNKFNSVLTCVRTLFSPCSTAFTHMPILLVWSSGSVGSNLPQNVYIQGVGVGMVGVRVGA